MTTDARPAEDTGPTDAMVADVFQRGCTSRHVLEAVTGRWGVLTVAGLRDGAARVLELGRRIVGLRESLRAQTLQSLERDGIVVREVRASIPPHVEYSLTDLGRRVADSLSGLIDVLEGAVDEVSASQRAYDARRD